MDIASRKKIAWYYELLPSQTKKALDFLSKEKWLENDGWYLAGGTALSLQARTRTSYDLDFFTTNHDFDEKKLLAHFIKNPNWKTEIEEKNTIYGQLYGAKVSFIVYPFFVPMQHLVWHGSIRVLQPTDIAVMKITAISQRGKKRDFFDLYWCAKNVEPLEHIIMRLKKQYPSVAHNYHHVLKSLVYFEDAENDPTPIVNIKVSWGNVKSFFKKEIPCITSKVIKLD